MSKLIETFEFKGEKEGLSLLVLAAIHGNEIAGVEALKRIIYQLDKGEIKLLSGQLTLVPIANPMAYQKDIRQIDENLNRVIKMHENPISYEQKLANEICPLIAKNDLMLDLHSTHVQGDQPFAFCDYPDEYNTRLIKAIEVKSIVTGWPDIYQNNMDISDCSTEQYAHLCQKRGTTLECGYHKDNASIELAYQSVLNVLKEFKMIEGENNSHIEKETIRLESYVVKEKEGSFTKDFRHLDRIKKDEVLAIYNDNTELKAPYDGYMLLPNPVAEIGAEWYYIGRKI